jgi:hypothetical protein
VEQLLWAPGLPELVKDRYLIDGGWVPKLGGQALNLYRPTVLEAGNSNLAQPWLDLVRKVYPNDVDHIVNYLSYALQHPGEKINHALLLGGEPGIGKDTILEPVRHGIGPWNFREVTPPDLLTPYNDFVKATMLRINEARDMGEVNRYQFYERMKLYAAAPPDTFRCNQKYTPHYTVVNCMAIVITSNYKEMGVYLPPDDRRHYVAWSDIKTEEFAAGFFRDFWAWYYEDGGLGHVAAYLARHKQLGFHPKASPPKTEAFWAIAEANRPDEFGELGEVINKLGNPAALTIADLKNVNFDGEINSWLADRRNHRAVPHQLRQLGYSMVRNSGSKDGRWTLDGHNIVIYAKINLTSKERFKVAWDRARGSATTATVTNITEARGKKPQDIKNPEKLDDPDPPKKGF